MHSVHYACATGQSRGIDTDLDGLGYKIVLVQYKIQIKYKASRIGTCLDQKVLNFSTVTFSFLFDKHYPIIE